VVLPHRKSPTIERAESKSYHHELNGIKRRENWPLQNLFASGKKKGLSNGDKTPRLEKDQRNQKVFKNPRGGSG